MSDQRDTLRNIRTFPQLIKFLRDELDWPIESEDFEELTFDYTPEELGIDTANAAKIQEIKRLRPLSTGQPWGIFFVKFEPKRLPVVALRRMLSRVVLKKRASANSADRAAWKADDLLFVSNYGEGTERQISFAHFSQNAEKADLPTLKVLGWDNRDTPLHLDDVADALHQRLAWPEDEKDAKRWREQWQAAFTLRHLEVITTSKDLAVRLAELAGAIRDRIRTVLAIETEKGPLTKLMRAFQQALIHDLSADDFADMYAQTIAYGLLSARVAHPAHDTADAVATHIPVTNPFLKELMETFLHLGGRKRNERGSDGIDFDELGISDVVDLLDAANMEAVVRDFGDRNRDEDPVIHFYELFLTEYDAKKRMQRGVFYTPQPVVSYIVRSVHEILQKEFGLEDGLADTTTWNEMLTRHKNLRLPEGASLSEPFVQILDPATGTGTFFVETIDLIHRTMEAKWKSQGYMALEFQRLWNEYVPEHLLPRLYGFELMIAPYSIAHMKIGLKLYETGYRFGSNERARVYLTNTLEEPADFSDRFEFDVPTLAHEAGAANSVKRRLPVVVIIGNPPYSGHSANNHIEWIVDKVHDYKRGLPDLQKPGQAKWLQDDYVKFIRYGEWQIDRTGTGILGYISNHSFLDNPTFRGMRRFLLNSFSSLRFVNLHGSTLRKEMGPGSSKDENVFDIQQGVAISLLSKVAGQAVCVMYGDVYGARSHKYAVLDEGNVRSLTSHQLHPTPEAYAFVPQDSSTRREYDSLVPIRDLMNQTGEPAPGIVTTHDEFAISWTKREAKEKVRSLLETRTEAEARCLFRLCSQSQWSYERAKRELPRSDWERQVCRILYRPFDMRWTVYDPNIAVHRRVRVMDQMRVSGNVALCITRINRGVSTVYFFVADTIVDFHVLDTAAISPFVFPLYCSQKQFVGAQRGSTQVNIDPNYYKMLKDLLGGDLRSVDVLHYIYAFFYAPSFRHRYAEFLRGEFPRVGIPRSADLLRQLAVYGADLVALHLVRDDYEHASWNCGKRKESPFAANKVWFRAEKRAEILPGYPKHDGSQVYINSSCWFEEVPATAWEFRFGGYQVCSKWLKDRRGRTLTDDEIEQYKKIVIAIGETIRLMVEIDKVIETHGGWPAAFITSKS